MGIDMNGYKTTKGKVFLNDDILEMKPPKPKKLKKNHNQIGTFLIQAFWKSGVISSLMLAYFALSNYGVGVLGFAESVFLVTSIILFIVQEDWKTLIKIVRSCMDRRKRISDIFYNLNLNLKNLVLSGGIHVFSFVCFLQSLVMMGPLITLLSNELLESIVHICGNHVFTKSSSLPTSSSGNSNDSFGYEGNGKNSILANLQGFKRILFFFVIGFLCLFLATKSSFSVLGFLFLVLSVILKIIRIFFVNVSEKQKEKQKQNQKHSYRKYTGFSYFLGFLLLFPFFLLSPSTTAINDDNTNDNNRNDIDDFMWFLTKKSIFIIILLVSIFNGVLDVYFDTIYRSEVFRKKNAGKNEEEKEKKGIVLLVKLVLPFFLLMFFQFKFSGKGNIYNLPDSSGFFTFLTGMSILMIVLVYNSFSLFDLAGTKNSSKKKYTVGHFMHSFFLQVLSHQKSRRIFGFFLLNLAFMFVELIVGIWTNSLGLITDACHMVFDCMALAMGLAAAVISEWRPNGSFSYGYGRAEVISGFLNGLFLVFVSIFILIESLERFLEPPEVSTNRLLIVSVLGFLVNLFGIFAFHDHHHAGGECTHNHHHHHEHHEHHEHEHHHENENVEEGNCNHNHKEHDHNHNHKEHDHENEGKEGKDDNMQGIFLHVLADTLGSVGVIISCILIEYFGWYIADPICSFCIAILIFASVIPLLKNSCLTLLQCLPKELQHNVSDAKRKILKIHGVTSIKNFHSWTFKKSEYICTVVICTSTDVGNDEGQLIRGKVNEILTGINITQTCIEIESN